MASSATKTQRARRLEQEERKQRRQLQKALPDYLPEATTFSRDLDLQNPIYLLSQLHAHGLQREIWEELVKATTVTFPEGRPRVWTSWVGAYLAYVQSGEPSVFRFYARVFCPNSDLVRACGFDPAQLPGHQTMDLRFAELEEADLLGAIERAAARLIRHAMSCEPRIGVDVAYDATAFSSPSRFHHDCPDRDKCREAGGKPRRTIARVKRSRA